MSIAAAWISGALFLIFLIRACPGWARCFTANGGMDPEGSEKVPFE